LIGYKHISVNIASIPLLSFMIDKIDAILSFIIDKQINYSSLLTMKKK